jgi:hypothetical protein
MKIYRLPQLTEASPDNQYCLGFEDLKTRAVYLFYGKLGPGPEERRLSAPEGHEEIVCVVKGKLLVKGGRYEYTVGEGEAFHLKGKDSLVIGNPYDVEAVYIAAGGRSFEEALLEEPKKPPQHPVGEKPLEQSPSEDDPQKQTLAN